MPRLNRDPGLALARLLGANIGTFGFSGTSATVESVESRPWASITFEGARHVLALRFAGPDAGGAADAFAAALPDLDLPLRGHFVADLAVARREADGEAVRLSIEALTVAAN